MCGGADPRHGEFGPPPRRSTLARRVPMRVHRIVGASSCLVAISLVAGCGSGASTGAAGAGGSGGGGGGQAGSGAGPQATCRTKGDLPFLWVRQYASNTSFLTGSMLLGGDGSVFLYGTYKATPTLGF